MKRIILLFFFLSLYVKAEIYLNDEDIIKEIKTKNIHYKTKKMNNKFDDYLHDYAVWTAARATQRGFVKMEFISRAINCTGLKDFVHSPEITTPEEFDDFHKTTCQAIIKYWNEKGVEKENICNVTWKNT